MTGQATRWEIEVAMLRGKPPLTANDRLHWAEKARRTDAWRTAAAWNAKAKKIPPQEHITVTLHYAPGDCRTRDASNLWPTVKPCLDGSVDAGVVPADDGRYVAEQTPVLHEGRGDRRLWLVVAATPRPETEETPK